MNFGNLLVMAAILNYAGSIPQKPCMPEPGKTYHVPSCTENDWFKGGVELEDTDGTKDNWYSLLPSNAAELELFSKEMRIRFQEAHAQVAFTNKPVTKADAITILEKTLADHCERVSPQKKKCDVKAAASLSRYHYEQHFPSKTSKNLHHSRGR